MSISLAYTLKNHQINVIKYNFKDLLNKGYSDLPSGIIGNNFRFLINNKVADVIVKSYSEN